MDRHKQWILFILLTLCSQGFGIEPNYPGEFPWLTGPLFTQSGEVVQIGHFNIEPTVFYTTRYARYNKDWKSIAIPKFNQVNYLAFIKIGIQEKIALSCTPQGFHNITKGVSSDGFGDLPIGFDFQLLEDREGQPPVKISVIETIPFGKYKELDPDKLGTDSIGLGTFSTQIMLATCNLFKFSETNYLSTCANFFVVFPQPVHVKGFNAYGGDHSTSGKVYPGTTFNFYCSAEYTLTENWALALDVLSLYALETDFRGYSDKPVGSPSSVQISLAPAIEYNFSKSLGIIAGSWFTVAGRNSTSFWSAAAAINYFY